MSHKGILVLQGVVDACEQAMRYARQTMLAPILLFLLPLTAHAVFTTPGSFDVGPDGSAGYTIPIQVPPGTAGMAPKLSLSYNSNGGNGVLGMGWSLEGLSQIGRCPKTMAQDGTRGGVNLDNNDRYCLDGQRLLSTGGTEYRSELANFAKIVSYGTAGNGPAWFKVWTKGGQIIEYGNTADSRIEAQGKTTVLAWSVNKISDTKGNYLTVSYTEDNANGETLVNRIDYTGNATATPALTPYASVQFTYETRPDPTTAYLAGSLIKSTKRMTNVRAYSGTTLVKDYRLTYELGAATQRSRLKMVMECDGNLTIPSCLSPTNLVSQDKSMSFTSQSLWNNYYGASASAGSWSGPVVRMTMDVNGDGMADIVGFGGDGVHVSLSTGSGFTPQTRWNNYYGAGTAAGSWSDESIAPRTMADVNGDGMADIVGFGSDGVHVSLSTGSGFTPHSLWNNYYGASASAGSWSGPVVRMTMDVNGDGMADIVGFGGDGVHVSLSTGSGFTPQTRWNNYYGAGAAAGSWSNESIAPRTMADVNGDGMADIVGFGSDGVHVSSSAASYPDLLTIITSGQGAMTTITYKSVTDGTVYTKDTGTQSASYPIQDLQSPMYVVSSVSTSDGLGGNLVTTYTYGGAKADLSGRGFLGYRWTRAVSPDTNLDLTTYYRQDYPYIGLPLQSEKRTTGGVLLSAVANTYANTVLTSGSAVSQFPYVSQTQEQNYELDGSLVTSTTTDYQYDDYGNATEVTVNSNDGFIKTTANLYANDVPNWLLGRLMHSSVTTTSP